MAAAVRRAPDRARVSAGTAIPLRDIHLPQAPGWWPPAPGWWLLAAAVLVVVALAAFLLWRRARRRRAVRRLFDQRVAAAGSAPARIAAMSELLRRAALEHDRTAAGLEGAEWLAFLDRGARAPAFDGRLGQLLLDGGYRREVDEGDLDALRAAARARFLALAGGRR